MTWTFDEPASDEPLDNIHDCEFCGKMMYLWPVIDGENDYVTMGGYHEDDGLYVCHHCIAKEYPGAIELAREEAGGEAGPTVGA